MAKRNFESVNKNRKVIEEIRQKPKPKKKEFVLFSRDPVMQRLSGMLGAAKLSYKQRNVKVTLPKVSFLDRDVPEE